MIDHRKLGRELDIFDSDPLIGAGLPFWLPAGAAARHEVESYLHELERRAGYQHVFSPVLGRRRMYELSGHWANFADDMFPPIPDGDEELVLRPSLCPHHALMFKARGRSYRELPLRIAELGTMYRAERSGVLGGLSRVRAIQLNDAHIFCALDQVEAEIAGSLRLMRQAHAALGLPKARYQLSLRGDGSKYAGSDEAWEAAGQMLKSALGDEDYDEQRGEAAFYGPKIDVQMSDAQGREFTIATVQVDFYQPERFGLSYIGADGRKQQPVMVHRSLAGSMERLFALLLEVHGGAFPLWYAPEQLRVVPVGVAQGPAAEAVVRAAVEGGLRAGLDADGSVGARVRAAVAHRIPYAGIVGEREAAAGLVALRGRDGRQLAPMPVADAVTLLRREVEAGKQAQPAAEKQSQLAAGKEGQPAAG
ncbi:threonine--tRNA ligase [Symbioplanes lichenis]|uniref:threonine--tRNA ligase n=1 Tax=Symbioplanes lichenis TaxID=1629072 RepID=UPI00273A18C1|nr:threonine--tRNA ligase [Actinoplanes lichenis]